VGRERGVCSTTLETRKGTRSQHGTVPQWGPFLVADTSLWGCCAPTDLQIKSWSLMFMSAPTTDPSSPPYTPPPSFSERAERLQLPSNRPPWHAEWPEWQLAACKTLRLPITFELRTFPLPTPSHATPRRQPPPRAPLHPLLTHHLRTNLTTLSDLSSPLFFAVEPSVCSACSLQVRLPDFGLLRLAFLHACPSSSSPTHRFLAPYPTPPTTH